ncbi:HEAT repeat domain-containing protein [Gaopeijia maritima]|uniref:HEAT repeat domain-containing protein n=1 Tax=Gaopeijia maritima TaxID=3119007 RepID=A0ABU9EAM7_9BACT
MTDTSHEGAAAAGGAAEWAEGDILPLVAVRELFVTFSKALRAFQLYDENNPVYQRFVSALRQSFESLWKELPALPLLVEEDRLVFEEAEVYASDSRSDSLAFLFFKDGIRALEFRPGIEDELEPFLRVLLRARHGRTDGDDLITLFWEADLQNLRYQFVDLTAEGYEMPDAGQGASMQVLQEVVEGELGPASGSESDPQAAGSVSQDDFNPTLYALDPREMDQLRTEIRREMERDVRTDVAAALMDRLEEPENPERQREILSIFRTLLPSLLSRGHLLHAALILRELRMLESRGGVLGPLLARDLTRLVDELSSPETVYELVRALEDGTLQPTPDELGRYLAQLRSGALAPLLRASELTELREIQPVLRGAVEGIARENPDRTRELLGDDDAVVVAGAARLVGRLGVADSGGALAELTQHPDPGVRIAAIEATAELRASTAAGALIEALRDSHREVRMAAARALGVLRYRPAAARFREIVLSKEVRNAEVSEKIAFFEGYGQIGDPQAVSVLSRMLNGRSFLGRKESAELRACAALALGKVGSPEAMTALRAAEQEDDAVVRSAVGRALRGGGAAG